MKVRLGWGGGCKRHYDRNGKKEVRKIYFCQETKESEGKVTGRNMEFI